MRIIFTPMTSETPINFEVTQDRVNGGMIIRHVSTGDIWFHISAKTGGTVRGKFGSLQILPPTARNNPYLWRIQATAHGNGPDLYASFNRRVGEYDSLLDLGRYIVQEMGLTVEWPEDD